MSIVKNFWLKNHSQKLAGAVIYQAMGETRARELASSVANPRTTSQMGQRVKWANLVNLYRANSSWMKFAFETKKTNQTDYNKFMSLNVANSRIYLPKQIANQGGCIVDSYIMTQGSLASIEVIKSGNAWQSNIYFTNSQSLDENATIGEVTEQLLPANPGLREGDQLSFIRLTQQTSASTGVPYVIVRKYEVILSSTDTRRFYDFMPEDYISWSSTQTNDCLQVEDSGNAGGFVLILSRTIAGKTYVSTQSIIVANNSDLIDAYSSQAALTTAIDSYGESSEPFLTTATANEDSQAAIRPSIVSVRVGADTYTPGSQAAHTAATAGEQITIRLSQPIAIEEVTSGTVTGYYDGVSTSIPIGGLSYSNGVITGGLSNLPTTGQLYMADVNVSTGLGDFRAVFVVPNSATNPGLD